MEGGKRMRIGRILTNVIMVGLLLILVVPWVYDRYENYSLRQSQATARMEQQEELQRLGMTYGAISMDDPVYDYLNEFNFTVDIKERLIDEHDRPVMFLGYIEDIVPEAELHYVLLEWNHPWMGAREVYAYLACDPKITSELRTLKWEARTVYALAILSDLKMVGFSQFFSEDSGSFGFFDGSILLIGELVDYAVDRASSSPYF